MRIFNKRGQSTLEYALIIAVVVAALLAMQIYAKRGVEGRLRASSDDQGDQFEADQTTFTMTNELLQNTKTIETTEKGVTTSSNFKDPERMQRTGTETVSGW